MTRIAFVSCSKTKASHKAPAAALYTSDLFRKSLLAALDTSKKVYILSAKHGVLGLGDIICPYDITFKRMPRAKRSEWGESTSGQLRKLLRAGDVASFYCGEDYIGPLRRSIAQLGCRLDEPLSRLSLGQRLQRLRALNDEPTLDRLFKRFYRIMRRLWISQLGGRRIADCSGQLAWPELGVYFITETELAAGGRQMPRIVRVGTHAVSLGSQASLWNRVSTHRGTGQGGGSHRSSIFRTHVGRALMNCDPHQEWPETWGKGQTAVKSVREGETALEKQVSLAIGDMKLLWLSVPDKAGPGSDRAYLERNTIGLLSRAVILSPTMATSWLGDFSDDWRIAASGLWNLDHLFVPPDPDFLDVLEAYVDVTIGRRPEPESSLAPLGWRSRLTATDTNSAQLDLFATLTDGHV